VTQTAEEEAFGPNGAFIRDLIDDCRVLGPSGIERIAWGRKRYVGSSQEQAHEFDEAARAAREVAQESGRGAAAAAAEAAVREITEGSTSPVAWRSEHGAAGEPAEDAALHAALALVVRDKLDPRQYHDLVKPMAEALPWLLPEEPPDEYR
jgi:hypothetical protein